MSERLHRGRQLAGFSNLKLSAHFEVGRFQASVFVLYCPGKDTWHKYCNPRGDGAAAALWP
eukprot:1157628-Pelagomonas_calceolata.AAC.8